MDDYFTSLIAKLKSGKLNSHGILREIDRSSIQNMSVESLGASDLKKEPSQTKEATRYLTVGNSNSSSLNSSQVSPKYLKFLQYQQNIANTPKGSASKVANSNKPNNPATSQRTKQQDKENNDPTVLPVKNKVKENRNEKASAQKKTAEKEKEKPNQIPPVSEKKGTKKMYSDEKIKEIRERSAKKNKEKIDEIRIQNFLDEEEEFERHCTFKPYLNDAKNEHVRSRYLEDRSVSPPKHQEPPFSFRPQINERPPGFQPSEKVTNYLSHDPFERLATPHAYGLASSQYAQARRSAFKSDKKQDSSDDSEEENTYIQSQYASSGVENANEIMKRYMATYKSNENRESSPYAHEKTKEVDESLVQCLQDTNAQDEDENEDSDAVENLEKEFERLMREGEHQFRMSELVLGEKAEGFEAQNLDSIDEMCKLSIGDFHTRQQAYERIKQRNIQEISKKTAPKHTPTICEKTKALVNQDPKLKDFESRSKYFEDKKKEKLDKIAQQRLQESNFKPKITKLANETPANSIDKMVYGYQQKKEEKLSKLRKEKMQKEVEELVLYPEINRKMDSKSKLGLNENVTDYVKKLREKEEVQQEFKKILDKRKELLETVECTHTPQITPMPKYLKKAKVTTKEAAPETNKYTKIHEKKTNAVSSRGLLKASTIEKALAANPNNVSQTLYLTVNDLWNASAAGEAGAKNDDDDQLFVAQGSFGINGESLNDLMQDFSPYGEIACPQKSFTNGQYIPDKFLQIEAIEEKDEKAEQTTAKSASRDEGNEDVSLSKRSSHGIESARGYRDYLSQAKERVHRALRADEYYSLPLRK